MEKNRTLLSILLLLVGAALSALLLFQHHGEGAAVAAVNQVCGEASGCEVVAHSEYAEVGGVPLAAIGLFLYLGLIALLGLAALAGAEAPAGRIGLFLMLAALLVDLWLLYLQAFELKAFCRVCVATYLVNAGVAWALWPHRRAAGFSGPAGRLTAAGSGIAVAALLLAVAAGEAALDAREKGRASTLLGTPASGAETLEQAQAEIKRLRETLDDPQKYEDYLQEKSVREFEAASVEKLQLERVPSKGPADAKIRVVEYSDFLCPFCRSLALALKDYLPRSGGRVSVYFKNYPLEQACNPSLQRTLHEGACWLALGGLCANSQGRFWEYHDRVFSAPPRSPKREDVIALGQGVGLNPAAFGACLDSPATRDQLQAEIAEANRVGVKGTPTLYINGKRLPRINDFLGIVEMEAARLGLPAGTRPGDGRPAGRP
jgi:protein-disulfide isomerase/uncharacterized membrane protein